MVSLTPLIRSQRLKIHLLATTVSTLIIPWFIYRYMYPSESKEYQAVSWILEKKGDCETN